jgi:hypothetical protein
MTLPNFKNRYGFYVIYFIFVLVKAAHSKLNFVLGGKQIDGQVISNINQILIIV